MRKLFTGFLLFGCLMTQARQISPGEAKAYASDFLSSQELQTATKALTPMKAPGVGADSQASPYYVFNRGEADGFVIISGDDRAPKILGYSDRGSFDASNLPPQLKAMMEQWATQMGQLPVGASQHPSWSKAPATRAEEGILLETAEWGQGYPYNALCPVIDGEQAPTGCVATAMAIAMKYHNWPDYTRGEAEEDFECKEVSFDFSNYTIDWNVLADQNNSGFGQEVSKLMLSLGVASQMYYGSTESSAYDWPFAHKMIEKYCYAKGCQYIPREAFSDSEWASMLQTQLKEVGPVIYRGSNSVGHAFIVDGFDGSELYHVNWGWDGLMNGYYTLDFTEMGFDQFQGMVINIVPDPERHVYSKAFVPNVQVYLAGMRGCGDWNLMNPDIVPGEKNRVKIPEYCLNLHAGALGIAVVDEDDNIIEILEGCSYNDGYRYVCPWPGADETFDITFPELKAGERFQLVSSEIPSLIFPGYVPAHEPSKDPKDWQIVLGGILRPSHFYMTGNNSEVCEMNVHVDEKLPFLFSCNSKTSNEFTLKELKGYCLPDNVLIPKKGVTYDLKSYDKEGNLKENVISLGDFLGSGWLSFNISMYEDKYEFTLNYDYDGDTRKDSEIAADSIVECDGLVYRIREDGVNLIGYDKISENIIVPDSVKVGEVNFPVIEIEDEALMFAPIKTLTVKASNLTKIGNLAFSGITNLEYVSFENIFYPSLTGTHPFLKTYIDRVYFDTATVAGLIPALMASSTGDQPNYVVDNDDISFYISKLPGMPNDPSDYLNILSWPEMLRDTYGCEKVAKEFFFPGLGGDPLDKLMIIHDVPCAEMWKYEIDKKNGKLAIKDVLDDIQIDRVLINSEVLQPNNNGIYTFDKSSEGRVEVTVEYTVNNSKKLSTLYSVMYNDLLDSTPLVQSVDSIALDPESWTGVEGESFTITATVLPENATDKTLVWASSDETIASVDSVGNVKALRIGDAVITAKAADGSDISASCAVKVNPVLVDSIAFTPESWTGVEGESFTITATVLPENATDKTLVWASSDETIASVDSVGNVKALRIGDAVITAKAADGSDISASCAVKVNPVLVDSIAFTPESWSGVEGESFTITATVLPENATDKTLVWASSDETIASVDSVGNVKALRIGDAVITAKAADGSDISASCAVKVNPVLVDSIAFTPESWSGVEGESFTITATVLPENATDKTLIWTSSDETIASVDSVGNVKALRVGDAVITAKAADGSDISASCAVKVNPVLVDSIAISRSEATLNAGETLSLTVTVLPENATDKTVIWTSNNEAVATVDSNGTVTALAVGTATITASCGEVSATCVVTVEPILVESIQLTPDNWSGVEGESFSIVAIVLPEDATDASIEWSSSDETVATVDDKGNVAVLKSGTCVITAVAVDGSGIYAECIITGTSGIDGIFSGSDSFDIYDLGGIQIKKDADRETLKTLTPGIYILRNGSEMKKLVIR